MDRAEIETVLREYHRPLMRLCHAYCHDPADSEDLYQEIAMNLWTAGGSFRGDASVRTWFYRVAHNTAISHKRKSWRRARVSAELDPAAPHRDQAPQPDSQAIDAERAGALRRVIQELGIEDRQLMTLHLEGLSLHDIEAITGVRAGTLATRLSRLRDRLVAILSPKEARR